MNEQQIDDFLRRVVQTEPVEHDGDVSGLVEALRAEPGSVVVIALPNGIRTLRVFFAVHLAGLVPVLVSPSTPPARVWEVARYLGARALVRARIRPADFGEHEVSRHAGADVLRFTGHRLIRHEPGHVILMSSGTSGLATGCLHSMSALLRNARRHTASIGQTAEDTVLVNLPVYYSFALVAQVLSCLTAGSRLVLSGPPFTVTDYLNAVVQHDVSISSLTPILAKTVAATGEELPKPLRTLTVGGQALDPNYVSRLIKLNPDLGVYLTYGLTEAGPRVSTLAAHREPPHRFGTVGKPLDGVEVLVRGSELLVRSDTVYRERVGEPAPSKRGELIEPGLIATGDIGFVDDDGYVVVRGRSTDFAVVRGEKVSLAGVRRVAESLPHVVRAATRVGEDHGTVELDVYVDEVDLPTETEMHQRLRPLLTRNERPGVVRVHALPAGEFHK
ncbi:class I adenylate-forming enzyme family protein [Allokutzneria albata]|uniref:Acyl-CoA synthetase (AMP-forming)/AMP-acid ligase II n=1 Tax=Allokutzneria albata TaxID=211114 RepID=A0A1G9TZT8_ALLAB|nr:class I adenylate-forming enzyme family protein [Allokutzneria albata]SDM53267.1 Acyl-CoA synthetase (AMP-forming)/AMP-acid ligase II [Allokutzneria albata]